MVQLQQNRIDSISQVRRFVRNAHAIEDSLLKFEFLKIKAALTLNQLKACEVSRTGISADLLSCRSDLNTIAGKYARSDQRSAEYLKQRNRYRLENWGWRGLALFVIYQSIKSTIQR